MLIGSVCAGLVYQIAVWGKTDWLYQQRKQLKDELRSHEKFKEQKLFEAKLSTDQAYIARVNEYLDENGEYEKRDNIWCDGIMTTKPTALIKLDELNKNIAFWEKVSPVTLTKFRCLLYRNEDTARYLAGE